MQEGKVHNNSFKLTSDSQLSSKSIDFSSPEGILESPANE